MKTRRVRKAPYSKKKVATKLSKPVVKAVKRIIAGTEEKKYIAVQVNNQRDVGVTSTTNCFTANIASILTNNQGVGVNQYLGRTVFVKSLEININMSNFVQTTAGGVVAPKCDIAFKVVVMKSNEYTQGFGAAKFETIPGTTGFQLGKEGLPNNANFSNWNYEKCSIVFERKIIVKPGNTDHANASTSLDQCHQGVNRKYYIKMNKKFIFEQNAPSALVTPYDRIRGPQYYILVYAEPVIPGLILTTFGRYTMWAKLNFTDA